MAAGDDAQDAAGDVLAPSAIEVTSSSEEAARVRCRLRLALGITVNQNNENKRKLAGGVKMPKHFKFPTVSGTIASMNDRMTFGIIAGVDEHHRSQL